MKENSLFDRKSLRQVYGKTADINELAKDCVAFSNAQGGIIDIGIEDGDELPPADQKIPDELATDLVNKLGGKTNGVILNTESLTADNGGEYIKIHILRNPNAIAATSSGKIYVRIGDRSVPVGPEDIVRLAADKGCLSWEDTLTKYCWQDADEKKMNDLVQRLRSSDRVSAFIKQKDVKELLDYFYLTDPDTDYMTQLGVLFIGKYTQRGRIMNPPVIQVIKYDQDGEKVNKWLWDDYTHNPLEMINAIWTEIPEWKESTEISEGMFRRNILAYPEKVLRELLANSLVHRPYTIKGDIFINVHPDHLEIVNPGQLPLGVTVENILHTTKKRNEHMANLFYALHMMEREGSGFDMMYETLLANGKAVPQVYEGEDFVMVRIDRRVINQEMIKVMQHADQNYNVKQKQLICLGLIAMNESLTATQLIALLNLKNAESLRSWLHPLIDKGLVMGTNEHSKAKEYRVVPEILKNSQYKGRTSLKRIESYRLKELIIEDLKIYKSASITEIQKRIGEEIPSKKIWNQLNILVDEGKVCKSGFNRWVRYNLVE
ncbi:MAG: putative DNA binding domain-containing protein [Paludibacteraceae bacterium]|nr:putative DNA binding domain-containing protein [Paludibacteraceae bacterium]